MRAPPSGSMTWAWPPTWCATRRSWRRPPTCSESSRKPRPTSATWAPSSRPCSTKPESKAPSWRRGWLCCTRRSPAPAVERRVSVLEVSLDAGQSAGAGDDAEEVQRQLLARLTSARRPGGEEALPVVIDEALLRIRGERKWELLDQVERLADKTQIVYL